jgi:hypothetical protein
MRGFERVLTDRLELRRPVPSADLNDLFVIFTDQPQRRRSFY